MNDIKKTGRRGRIRRNEEEKYSRIRKVRQIKKKRQMKKKKISRV